MYDINLSVSLIRLGDQIRHRRPDYYQCFNSALSASEQEVITKPFGWQLPKEVFTLYQWKNGQQANCRTLPFVHDMRFLSLEESMQLNRELTNRNRATSSKTNRWRSGWLPLFTNGEEYVCFDTEGTFTGRKGQLVSFSTATDRLEVLVPSLELLISLLTDFYQSDVFELSPDYVQIAQAAQYPITIKS